MGEGVGGLVELKILLGKIFLQGGGEEGVILSI